LLLENEKEEETEGDAEWPGAWIFADTGESATVGDVGLGPEDELVLAWYDVSQTMYQGETVNPFVEIFGDVSGVSGAGRASVEVPPVLGLRLTQATQQGDVQSVCHLLCDAADRIISFQTGVTTGVEHEVADSGGSANDGDELWPLSQHDALTDCQRLAEHLRKRLDPLWPNRQPYWGSTTPRIVCRNAVASTLASIPLRETGGQTLLHLAAGETQLGVVEALVGHDFRKLLGLETEARKSKRSKVLRRRAKRDTPVIPLVGGLSDFCLHALVDRIDDHGWTALVAAASYGGRRCLRVCKRLLQAGADAALSTPESGKTALHYLAQRDMFSERLDDGERGSSSSLVSSTVVTFPLHEPVSDPVLPAQTQNARAGELGTEASRQMAIRKRFFQAYGPSKKETLPTSVVELILRSGVDIDAKTNKGETPVQLSCVAQSEKNVALFLAFGAYMFGTNGRGETLADSAWRGAKIQALKDLGSTDVDDSSIVDLIGPLIRDLESVVVEVEFLLVTSHCVDFLVSSNDYSPVYSDFSQTPVITYLSTTRPRRRCSRGPMLPRFSRCCVQRQRLGSTLPECVWPVS
jgi:Ankyrin repeat